MNTPGACLLGRPEPRPLLKCSLDWWSVCRPKTVTHSQYIHIDNTECSHLAETDRERRDTGYLHRGRQVTTCAVSYTQGWDAASSLALLGKSAHEMLGDNHISQNTRLASFRPKYKTYKKQLIKISINLNHSFFLYFFYIFFKQKEQILTQHIQDQDYNFLLTHNPPLPPSPPFQWPWELFLVTETSMCATRKKDSRSSFTWWVRNISI